MLLPEPVTDLSVFDDRPVWTVIEDGVLRQRAASTATLARLERCSLVVARRRHQMWTGPIAGVRIADDLRRAWLVELVDVDHCPWGDPDSIAIFDFGLVAVLEYVRLFGARGPRRAERRPAIDGLTLPDEIHGPRIDAWRREHGRS